MKVLYVHDRLGAFAGAESNAFLTATELGRRGHQLALLHGPSTGRNIEAWYQTFPTRYPVTSTSAAADTSAALSGFQPDVVYAHNLAHLKVTETLVRSGRPLVRIIHDHSLYCLRSYRYNVFTRSICTRPASGWCVFPCLAPIARNRGPGLPLRWASYATKRREMALHRRFHRLIAVSNFMRGELLANGFDAARIETHLPIPPPNPNDQPASFSDRNLILFAGQIVRGKGVDVLLQSLAKLKSRFECVVLGDGSHRSRCERLSRKLGLSPHVRFAGFVNQTDLADFFHQSSVVALPSVWPEPAATIGLEVMSHALPVVAFDVGGIRDWLTDGHNGYLVPWMDRALFAARLDLLLQDKPLARRLGRNGLNRAREQFDFTRYIGDLENLLHRVVLEARTTGNGSPQ